MKKITQDQYYDLVKRAREYVAKYPTIRFGQALFNLLWDDNEMLAKSLIETANDPYEARVESDYRVTNFFNTVVEI